MIITTELLNNIETNLANPQPQGIYYITIDENHNLSTNYNQVITQLEAGNLPMIIEEDDNSITFFIVTEVFYEDNTYRLITNNLDVYFYAGSPTENFYYSELA